MVDILIVDDHAVVREGLKQILSEIPDMTIAGEASTGAEALKKITGQKYDLILLDISLPGRNGLDVLKQMHQQNPDVPVLILTIYPEEQYAIRALKLGAAGYLTKESAPEELVKAIKKVCCGKKYITPSLAERLAFMIKNGRGRLPHENLSDREYEVLRMIASGKRVSDIAEDLSLSVKTVSTYRSRILEKMKMKTNSELTLYAIRNRLVS